MEICSVLTAARNSTHLRGFSLNRPAHSTTVTLIINPNGSHSNHSGSRTRHNPPAQRSRWWLNLFICMPHGVLSLDYDRWQSRQLLNWIQCCRFCFLHFIVKNGLQIPRLSYFVLKLPELHLRCKNIAHS